MCYESNTSYISSNICWIDSSFIIHITDHTKLHKTLEVRENEYFIFLNIGYIHILKLLQSTNLLLDMVLFNLDPNKTFYIPFFPRNLIISVSKIHLRVLVLISLNLFTYVERLLLLVMVIWMMPFLHFI